MSLKLIKNEREIWLIYQPYSLDDTILSKLCIDFDSENNLIRYSPETLPKRLRETRPATYPDASLWIKKVFTFLQSDLVDKECDGDTLVFRFAYLDDRIPGYFKVKGRIFSCTQDLLLVKDFDLDWRLFCVGYERRTSVIKKISSILDESEHQIIIGGDNEKAIPIDVFKDLVDRFPTTLSLEQYGEALIERYIQEYLLPRKDYGAQLHCNLARKQQTLQYRLGNPAFDRNRVENLNAAQQQLKDLLNKSDTTPEESWQQGVLDILPVLFPQYVAVIPKVAIEDRLTGKSRQIDFLLVDASGNVDVLEIKRAFPKNHLLMLRTYRDNCIPARELSGGISQIEKYIHLLLNWSVDGEKKLTERYSSLLPKGLKIRFLTPHGLLLIGNCKFNETEQRDFDLIRRQYAHITDIITYTDLLQRLENMIDVISPADTGNAQTT